MYLDGICTVCYSDSADQAPIRDRWIAQSGNDDEHDDDHDVDDGDNLNAGNILQRYVPSKSLR